VTEAVPVAEKKCTYKHDEWSCPFVAEDGYDLCIFHLPIDKKESDDFWRHLASYLSVLGQLRGPRVEIQVETGNPLISSCQDARLWHYYDLRRPPGKACFIGFRFPGMDAQHSLKNFTFGIPADFGGAEFGGEADFQRTKFSGQVNFADAKFGGMAEFDWGLFTEVADFSNTEFQAKATFHETSFLKDARFVEARFRDELSITNAMFHGKADLWWTHFHGRVQLAGVSFKGDVSAVGAHFEDVASLGNVTFVGKADFGACHFKGKALFEKAHFCAQTLFEETIFRQSSRFIEAVFESGANFNRAQFENEAEFSAARFSGPVDFNRAIVSGILDFTRIVLHDRLLFEGTSFDAKARVLLWDIDFARGTSYVSMEKGYEKGQIVEPAGQVVFRDISAGMNRVSFLHTDILTDRLLVRFLNVKWETNPEQFIFDAVFTFREPAEWQTASSLRLQDVAWLPVLFHTEREIPKHEFGQKALNRIAVETLDCWPLVRRDVERIAREIRLSHEKYGHYGDAGDYYVAEMDFRRKRTPWLLRHFPELRTERRWWLRAWKRLTGFLSSLSYRLALELYRFTSHYGESPGRALLSSLVTLGLSSYAFVIAGFEFMGRTVNRDMRYDRTQFGQTISDLWLAFRMALANLMPGNLRADVLGLKLTSEASKSWAVAQVICTYILITLLLLAIRRRFRR
jgi:uncharacterized protein YjbI with pentapeptide repeats